MEVWDDKSCHGVVIKLLLINKLLDKNGLIMILNVNLIIWSGVSVYYKVYDHGQWFELIWECCVWV